MSSLVSPENSWVLGAVVVSGAALSIALEQRHRWASRLSGPVLALLGGMLLSNAGWGAVRLLPTDAPAYDFVERYLVPVAIPLLLFRANVGRILRETGPMFRAFHIAALGTCLGTFLAAFLFRHVVPQVAPAAGVMAASYIGGSVNFAVIAVVNLVVTLGLGRLWRMNLEELLLSVNATLGGPPSAIAMAVSAGWPRLALPGLLAGLWGYVTGTFIGIAIAETLFRMGF